MILQILATIGMAILGMLLQAWYNALTTPETGNFSWTKFVDENNYSFIMAVAGICLIISILGMVPEASQVITTVTGFTLTVPISNGGAIFLGGFVYEQCRKKFKK